MWRRKIYTKMKIACIKIDTNNLQEKMEGKKVAV